MFVADPVGPAAVDDPLDDARRLPRRRRRRGDQPLPRARVGRAHGADQRATARERPDQPRAAASPSAIALGVARDRPARADRQRPRRGARRRRAARLRLRLHAVAEAAHARRTSSSAAPPARCRRWSAGRPPPARSRPQALWPFAIVFFWTPPHFWALSLLIADDYARTGVPMLPVVRGEATTRRQILGYSVLLVAVSRRPGR